MHFVRSSLKFTTILSGTKVSHISCTRSNTLVECSDMVNRIVFSATSSKTFFSYTHPWAFRNVWFWSFREFSEIFSPILVRWFFSFSFLSGGGSPLDNLTCLSPRQVPKFDDHFLHCICHVNPLGALQSDFYIKIF